MKSVPGWQLGVPDDWQMRVSQLVDEYTEALGVSKGALARALGFGKDLSPSSFAGAFSEARRQRLLECLCPGNIPITAAKLGLPLCKYAVVESLFSSALKAVGGWDVEPHTSRGAYRESIDYGFVGVELFDQGQWEAALPYLYSAWAALSGQQDQADTISAFAMLRVGTQLISLDSYVGAGPTTARRVQELNSVARRTLAGTSVGRDTLRAVGHFYTSAAVAHRHIGSLAMRERIGYSVKAASIFAEDKGGQGSYIAALRDQAKPLVYAAVTSSPRLVASQLVSEAFGTLARADAAAGGKTVAEDLSGDWIFTRMTQIECHAALGESSAARKLWEDTWERDWVPTLLAANSHTPLASKCAVADMSVLASEGRLEELGSVCEAYLGNPANAPYKQRENRVKLMMEYAEEPDNQVLLKAIFR